MINLIQIASGWYRYARGTDATRKLMESRLAKCSDCPFRKQLSRFGKEIVQAIHEDGSTYKCGRCNCPLSSLTSLPAAKCKAGRW